MAGRAGKLLPIDIATALPNLRQLCGGYPGCTESLSYGNPAFKRGSKPFAVLDRYKGKSCLWLLIDPALRDDQIKARGWFASPYDPRERALCCELDFVDWHAVAGLVRTSYELAARAL